MLEKLGILNIILLSIIVGPFVMRLANKYLFDNKSKIFIKPSKYLRAVHKPAALLLIISISAHAYIAFGTLRLHTGTIAAVSFVLTAVLGLTFYLTKKPPVLKIHRTFLFLSVFLLSVHLLMPNLISP